MTDGLGQSPVSSTSRPTPFCDICIILIDNNICCYKCAYFCNSLTNVCGSISDLQQQHRNKILKTRACLTTLTVNENRAVASLIGKQCLISC